MKSGDTREDINVAIASTTLNDITIIIYNNMVGNISIKDKNYLRLILITYVTIDNVAGIGIFLDYTFFDI